MCDMYARSISLIGEQSFAKLQNVTVAVIGLGGVGGTALEGLARSGIASFVVVDSDKVDLSNLNRQILYTRNDIGVNKVDAAKKRLLDINRDLEIFTLKMKVDELTISELDKYKIDFIVDAIDDVNGKIAVAKYANDKHIPLIVSLGMANRIDSTKVEVIRLNKTTDDPLAKKLRYEFKNAGIDTSKIDTVFSKEVPLVKGKTLSSMMMVPSSAGLAISYYVIKKIIE